MGPLGTFTGPNITKAGLGGVYSDGELKRLIEHGIKKNGKGVRFMPSHEINWLSDDDVIATIAYVRSVKPSKKPNGPFALGTLAKVLDRQDAIIIDVARKVDHKNIVKAPAAAPTAAYGKFVAKLCLGCHGDTCSGGKIPGVPPNIPIPPNITPHETGIKSWAFSDFERLLDKGIKKDGSKLDPFMPLTALTNMDQTERKALFAFLMSVEPKEFGNR